jgi:hypothetical protein
VHLHRWLSAAIVLLAGCQGSVAPPIDPNGATAATSLARTQTPDSTAGQRIFVAIGDDAYPPATRRRANAAGVAYGVVSLSPTANGASKVLSSYAIAPSVEQFPYGVAIDPKGNVHVAGYAPSNQQTGPNAGSYFAIAAYAPNANGKAKPSSVVSGASLDFDPDRIAYRHDGTLFVTSESQGVNGPGYILIFPPGAKGNVAPRVLSGNGLASPIALAFDRASNLYVANQPGDSGSPFVSIFTMRSNGSYTFERSFRTNAGNSELGTTGFGILDGIAVGAAGDIFVADRLNGWVYRFPGDAKGSNAKPKALIGRALLPIDAGIAVKSIAVDRQDHLYMLIVGETTPSKIAVFPASATTGTRPTATITSNALTYPQAIAVGP